MAFEGSERRVSRFRRWEGEASPSRSRDGELGLTERRSTRSEKSLDRSSDAIRLARSHVRPLPVAHKPMNLVILNMCVTSEASMSLSCVSRGREGERASTLRD